MIAILLTICLSTPGGALPESSRASLFSLNPLVKVSEQQSPATSPTSESRVVVTLVLEGVRVPSVTVSLRSVDGNIVVGQTTSDSIGQVTFPDVPTGRYIVRAVRDGFADSESSPFDVRAGETEQVLVEMR
ncbi:MAG TPA: carboxypeptidase-like regulatory domain-containing protein, partial [Terrimicrobiaceae bacterium]|nr:carboxypeptidase-like regulatory domain-containing protein [Terrimicrobiaceae bacterium]